MPLLCPGCMSELAPEATNCGVCLRPRSRQEIFKGIRDLQAQAARRRRKPLIIAGLALAVGAVGYVALKRPPALAPVVEKLVPARAETPAPAAPAPAPAPAAAPTQAPAPAEAPTAPVTYSLSRPGAGKGAAQDRWTFTGRAYDLLSLKPIAGATVSFENPATGKKWSTKTGKDGRYKALLPPVTEGGYAVDVRHPRYRPGFLDEADVPYFEQSEARRVEAGRLLRESVIVHVPLRPEDGEQKLTYDAVLAPLPR